MKSSINIGKIFGIDLKINITFLFLLAWVALSSSLGGASPGDILLDTLFIIALFVLVVLHELGHALTAKHFGIKTKDITLLPIGGIANLEKMPEDPKQELMVAIAGPAVNFLIGGVLLVVLLVSGITDGLNNLTIIQDNFWVQLLTANITLALFNLIPAFPMDGGRVLRSLLSLRMNPNKATNIAANIGKIVAIIMGFAGFLLNPWLILTAVFIWIGASAELRTAQVQAGLEGLQVQDAMISQFYQVEGNQTLESVLQLSIQTGQYAIPVTSNGHFLGIIRREDLLDAFQHLGKRAPAYAAIGLEPEGLSPTSPLKDILVKFNTSRVLPVIEGGKLIGLLTPESMQQQMWLHQKINNSHPPYPDEGKNTI